MAETKPTGQVIGFFGGTFNPIHFGHLHLALSLLEQANLTEVWFCPASMNPFRQDEPPIAAEHRLRMAELAVADIPAFKVIDTECRRSGPSYTVDTIRQLIAENRQGVTFRLILGDDALQDFADWREPEELVRLAPPLVGQRSCFSAMGDVRGSTEVVKALCLGWRPLPLLEISATEVRARLQKGLYCGHLIPAKVLDYIDKHRLY